METSLTTENSGAVSPARALGAALPAPCCPPRHLALTRAHSGNPRLKGQCHERGCGQPGHLILRGLPSPSRPQVAASLSYLEPFVHCRPIPCSALQPKLNPRGCALLSLGPPSAGVPSALATRAFPGWLKHTPSPPLGAPLFLLVEPPRGPWSLPSGSASGSGVS